MVELTCKRGVCHFVTVTCNKYLTKCRVSGYRLEIMNSNWVCEDRETGCDASLWFSYGFLSKWFWAAQGTIWEEDVRYHELYLGLWWTEGGLNMSLWFFYDFLKKMEFLGCSEDLLRRVSCPVIHETRMACAKNIELEEYLLMELLIHTSFYLVPWLHG